MAVERKSDFTDQYCIGVFLELCCFLIKKFVDEVATNIYS